MNKIAVKFDDDVTLLVHCEGLESQSVLFKIKEELERYFEIDETSPLTIPEKLKQLREIYHLKRITIQGGDFNE